MLTKLKYLHSFRGICNRSLQAFGGGHGHGHGHGHEQPYDWRDDPKYNPDLHQDIRDRGWNPDSYSFPYQVAHDGWYFPQFPDNYTSTDISLILKPENKLCITHFNTMRVINKN